MADSRPIATPLDYNATFNKACEGDTLLDDVSYYQSIIGSLMYAVMGTRPDIAYTVTML
jgi:hypothetical protein